MLTHYIAAYDTESLDCLEACRRMVPVHKRHQMPATFFIVGSELEQHARAYRELLDDPLFEIASHTWSHKMLKDHPLSEPVPPPEVVREEIFRSKAAVERVFERPCLGLRPAVCWTDGLRGAQQAIDWVAEAGYRYVSSQLWGPDYSQPAPLNRPFNYADHRHPQLWDLPGHGWHENLLKDNNRWGPRRVTLWPPLYPEAIPDRFIATPEEEVKFNNRLFIEKALATGMPYVSLIWHPWSLLRFDPEMRMLDLTFTLVREMKLPATTYAEMAERITAKSE